MREIYQITEAIQDVGMKTMPMNLTSSAEHLLKSSAIARAGFMIALEWVMKDE